MYPHERSLVARLQGKPFALLGVNSDPIENALKAVKTNNLTWRSWWDGGSPGGPIAESFNVGGWPTLFLIDHRGVIRKKFEGPPQDDFLDAAIDQLIEEAEADRG